jgi:hypothetical protein
MKKIKKYTSFQELKEDLVKKHTKKSSTQSNDDEFKALMRILQASTVTNKESIK